MKYILLLTVLLATHCMSELDVKKELTFAEHKALAEKGRYLAQYTLALKYQYGSDVPENDAEAVKWFRKAANQGFVYAQ